MVGLRPIPMRKLDSAPEVDTFHKLVISACRRYSRAR
jgi:hypothetical protein